MRTVLLENEDGRLVLDLDRHAFLHVKLYRWGAQRFKRYQVILEAVLTGLQRAGCDAVYATPRTHDLRAQKLIRMFGFTERRRTESLVLMERRL